MLVLSRKAGETLRIGEATLTVVRVSGGKVRIGIEAPSAVPIRRSRNLGGAGVQDAARRSA